MCNGKVVNYLKILNVPYLEAQLIQKALVLQAEKDSLPVSEEELEGQLR